MYVSNIFSSILASTCNKHGGLKALVFINFHHHVYGERSGFFALPPRISSQDAIQTSMAAGLMESDDVMGKAQQRVKAGEIWMATRF